MPATNKGIESKPIPSAPFRTRDLARRESRSRRRESVYKFRVREVARTCGHTGTRGNHSREVIGVAIVRNISHLLGAYDDVARLSRELRRRFARPRERSSSDSVPLKRTSDLTAA